MKIDHDLEIHDDKYNKIIWLNLTGLDLTWHVLPENDYEIKLFTFCVLDGKLYCQWFEIWHMVVREINADYH